MLGLLSFSFLSILIPRCKFSFFKFCNIYLLLLTLLMEPKKKKVSFLISVRGCRTCYVLCLSIWINETCAQELENNFSLKCLNNIIFLVWPGLQFAIHHINFHSSCTSMAPISCPSLPEELLELILQRVNGHCWSLPV